MVTHLPFIVLGFHGCDEKVGRAVIAGETQLQHSRNDYDWLGHGIYFWENAPWRAWQFACEQKKRGVVKTPFVIGALLDLGDCVNLLDINHHQTLRDAYEIYNGMFPDESVRAINKGGGNRVLRRLDCAVFQALHFTLENNHELPVDSVRCAFEEGSPTFPGSDILDKTHIQICIRNPACVKGYFRPLDENGALLKF